MSGEDLTRPKFAPGQRARIKPDAFGDANEPEDRKARGQIGTLITQVDEHEGETLWLWRGDNGLETYPYDGELEAVSDE